jgi:hypothetical protein
MSPRREYRFWVDRHRDFGFLGICRLIVDGCVKMFSLFSFHVNFLGLRMIMLFVCSLEHFHDSSLIDVASRVQCNGFVQL